MASLQKKADAWYCQITFRGQRHTYTIGKVEESEAKTTAAKADYLLMRLKQGLLTLPDGVDIVTFLQNDGKPPATVAETVQKTSLASLRDSYLQTFGNGAMESNSIYTARIHLNHLSETLGEKFILNDLKLADLQGHINRRQEGVAGITIRKEIDTLRSAWNWAERMGMVKGNFPGKGLVYPKGDEKLPFMTWEEIEQRIQAGGDPDTLWECLYLTAAEIAELLKFLQGREDWVYLAFVFIAHTGARRSEMLRAQWEDIDKAAVTIREKKRVKGSRSTRRVPMSSLLAKTLKSWRQERKGKPFLFGPGNEQMAPQSAQEAFEKALAGSKWAVLKGWHVLRHSFISALASRGIDQRFIDDFVGHTTEAMRRRYRHLYPSTQDAAIKAVFG